MVKFPIKQFLTASSEVEEEALIERYSQQRQSVENYSQNCYQVMQEDEQLQLGMLEVYMKKAQESQLAVQNTNQSVASTVSLKPFKMDETPRSSVNQVKNALINKAQNYDPKLLDDTQGHTEDETQMRLVTGGIRHSVVNASDSECAFRPPNRSPDSFIRVDTHGPTEYKRQSLISKHSSNSSDKNASQGPSFAKQTSQEKTNDGETPRSNKNIELNVETFIQLFLCN
jgi:hypothetical protein